MSGITPVIVASGTESGIPYIDIQLSGTAVSGNNNIKFDGNQTIAASVGQTWSQSVYLKLVSGSWANINNVVLFLSEDSSSGSGLGSLATTYSTLSSQNGLATQRYTNTGTISQTNTSYVQPVVQINPAAGAINLTLRIGMPQLEQTSYATSVIPTYGSAVTRTADVYSEPSGGTYFNSAGVLKMAPANTPRLDYGPGGGNYPLGVLIEESRTNLWTNSTTPCSWPWSAGSTSTGLAFLDGTSACLFTEDNTLSYHGFTSYLSSINSTVAYSFSLFAKNVSMGRYLRMGIGDGTGNNSVSATFDLSNANPGTVVNVTNQGSGTGAAGYVQALTGGWYKVTVVGTPSSANNGELQIAFRQQSQTSCCPTSQGDGVSNGTYAGAQVEAGAFPTSYIPTSGSAVTRAADVFTLPTTAGPGSGWLTQGQGTLAANATAPYLTSSDAINLVDIDDGTGNNAIQTFIALSGYYFEMFTGGAQQYQNDSVGSYTPGTLSQTIQAYQTNSANKAYNDTLVGLSSSVTVPSSLTTLRIGARRGAAAPGGVNGWINRVTYFPIRHPDASLPEFTNY